MKKREIETARRRQRGLGHGKGRRNRVGETAKIEEGFFDFQVMKKKEIM
ncbi:hypothetical protein LINGRAHAP2_LOCUS29022, partial [Linum grandiflorum]